MRFSPDELTELAGFFAKRFPRAADLRSIAADAGLEPGRDPMASAADAWTALLHAADSGGRMRLLAHAAARRGPDDANLMSVCQVITGTRSPGRARIWDHPRGGAALAGAAVAVLAASAFVAFRSPGAEPTAPTSLIDAPVAEPSVAAAPAADTPADGLVAIEAPTTATGGPKPWKAGNPLDAVRTVPATPPEAAPAKATVAPDPANHSGRCTLEGGGIVGYWYAGRSAPAAAGDTLVMPNSVNVRTDYPDTHNGFDARTALRCTLAEGDRIRLTADPIAVPGGAFWVPLHSGDLLTD